MAGQFPWFFVLGSVFWRLGRVQNKSPKSIFLLCIKVINETFSLPPASLKKSGFFRAGTAELGFSKPDFSDLEGLGRGFPRKKSRKNFFQ